MHTRYKIIDTLLDTGLGFGRTENRSLSEMLDVPTTTIFDGTVTDMTALTIRYSDSKRTNRGNLNVEKQQKHVQTSNDIKRTTPQQRSIIPTHRTKRNNLPYICDIFRHFRCVNRLSSFFKAFLLGRFFACSSVHFRMLCRCTAVSSSICDLRLTIEETVDDT